MNNTHSYIPLVPLTVPKQYKNTFIKNYQLLTHSTDRLFLFAADHKLEHLNQDFYGADISPQAMKFEHVFNIASQNYIGGLATQLGLIARYGSKYRNIPYVIKLNSKTNLIPKTAQDPLSKNLWSISNVIKLREESNLNICGIGITLYLGSKYEDIMLTQAAQAIYEAHSNGLVTILWIYPRGSHIEKEKDFELIAGAAGVANALGADFVKLKAPEKTENQTSGELLKIVTQAAGNTKVVCSGESKRDVEKFFQDLYDQISIGGTAGCAIGRNIFQRPRSEAIALTKAINLLIYQRTDLNTAINAYKNTINTD